MDPNSGVIGEGFPVAFLKQYYVFDPSFVGSHAKACDEFVKGLNQEEKKQLAKILYKEYGQYITTENKAGDSHE
jgi:hypothetical protein